MNGSSNGKFKIVRLHILLSNDEKATVDNLYNFYFSDKMTIVVKENNDTFSILPPFPNRTKYNDNDTFSITNSRKEPDELIDFFFFWEINKKELKKLRNFFWDDKFFSIENNESKGLSFDKQQDKIIITIQPGAYYGKNDKEIQFQNKKTITITPSTTPMELANALPELDEEKKQKMFNSEKEVFCNLTHWCGFDLCSLNCFQRTKQQTNT